jgi:hypothetical protein
VRRPIRKPQEAKKSPQEARKASTKTLLEHAHRNPTGVRPERLVRYSEEEDEQHESAVLELWLQYATQRDIQRIALGMFPGITRNRVFEVIKRVQKRQREVHEDERKTSIERAIAATQRTIARIENRIRVAEGGEHPDARGARALYGLKLRYMEHLAKIEGTYAPLDVRLTVDVNLSATVQAVMAALTPEQVAEMAAQRQRELLILNAAQPPYANGSAE